MLAKAKIQTVIVKAGTTNVGAIETVAEARACAELFRQHRDAIDGVLVTLPNFGDERAIANVLRWSELHVPVLIHAFTDDPKTMSIDDRRDSFCGKIIGIGEALISLCATIKDKRLGGVARREWCHARHLGSRQPSATPV